MATGLRILKGLTMAGAALLLSAMATAQAPIRTPLRVFPVDPGKSINRIETTQVDFAPGQIMPRHKHTVPVVCFVTRGAFMVKIGDAPEAPVSEGAVTYELPGVVVGYFRNASTTAPARLGCVALASDADTVLNVMLP